MADRQNPSDSQLLQLFVNKRDNNAFREIFNRYYRLVWSACRRRFYGQEHLAEDAVQAVFLVLFRHAGRIKTGVALPFWLYQTARFVSANIHRSELHRREREKKAADMENTMKDPLQETGWEDIRVHLDQAIDRLPGKQRSAVIMHYLAGKSLGEISDETGIARTTIQHRVESGIGRLKTMLSGRNRSLSVATLGALILENSLEVAPPGLQQNLFAAISAQISSGGAAMESVVGMAARQMSRMTLVARMKLAAGIILATAIVAGAGAAIFGVHDDRTMHQPESIALPAVAEHELVVDCGRKYQTIVGLGNCEMHWTAGDMYDNKDVIRMYVEDLGGSIIRFLVSPDVLPYEVADAMDISYKNFKVEGGIRKKLDFIAAVYAANPGDMTVIGSIFSPPAWMKTNNSRKNGGSLRPDRVEHFAKYVAEWVLYMREVSRTPVHYVSIQNEPAFVEPYDSCVYKADFYAKTALAVCDALKAANLDTKLFGPEDMTWNVNNIVNCVNPILKEPRGRERLTAVASHGYVDGIKSPGDAREAVKLWHVIEQLGVQWWMTETSGESPVFLGIGKDEKGKNKRGAFNLAATIHNALVYGNASAWVYLNISGHYQNSNDSAAAESLMNGDKPTKKYFVSRQFYRHIRPGAIRVDAGPDGENNIQISAFLHEKNKTLTIVMLNHEAKDTAVTLNLKSAPVIAGFEVYQTDESDDFKRLENVSGAGGKTRIVLAARSIVTLYGRE